MGHSDRHQSHDSRIARDAASGLLCAHKHLPAYLFYDDEGSRLYEQITNLPEYYLTRAEREIFVEQAEDILAATGAATVDEHAAPLKVIELGAGTAEKSQILLAALTRTQGACDFWPIDVSAAALSAAIERMERELPSVRIHPLAVHHEEALGTVRALGPMRMVLFIGSSIGNFDDEEAQALLTQVRGSLSVGDALLLGTDLRKSRRVMLPAYDDAQGVTAAFNKNALAHLNRALGAHFDLERFRHVAVWNEHASRVEMHLESLVDQRVPIDSLGAVVRLRRGERIHTESSVKYDEASVDRLLESAGFHREHVFRDRARFFAVHLARAC